MTLFSYRKLALFFLFIGSLQVLYASDHQHGDSDPLVKFVENKQQWEDHILFQADVPGGRVFFEQGQLTYHLADLSHLHDSYFQNPLGRRSPFQIEGHAFRMKLQGSNENAIVSSENPYPEYRNYFIGDDPEKWAGRVGMFGTIRYQNVYDDMDLVFYGNEKAIKYDFELQAYADPNQIKLSYDGLDGVFLDAKGNLVMKTSVADVTEMAPVAYQIIAGERIEIPCSFVLWENQLSFDLGEYDHSKELIIDPNLIFASYTGSTADNFGYTATYDDQGNLYGSGIAFGLGYPTVVGSYNLAFSGGGTVPFGGGFDISISKFDPNGTTLLWSTFLGGTDNEQPHSTITTSNDELIVFGRTWSSDYPTTAGAYQTANAGGTEIIVTKFDAAGANLIGSTYVGGSGDDGVNIQTNFFQSSLYFNYGDDARGEVMIDAQDNVYIASCTKSNNFPVTGSAFQTAFGGGGQDGCVFKLNPSLTNMQWASYLGGSGNDAVYSVKVDNNNNVFVAGGTESSNFPTTPGALNQNYQGAIDGFVSKIDPVGSNLLASSFVGTSSYDQCFFLEIDDSQDIYLTGQTTGNYPVSPNVYSNPNGKQFIQKMDNNLTTSVYSTVFGSGGATIDISPTAFLVDRCGFIYVAGWGGSTNYTGSTNNLPLTNDAYQSTTDGSDIYLIVLAPDAAILEYATYFGGATSAEHVDGGTSRFNPNLEVYHAVCAGCGGNSDFPTTPGVVSNTNNSTNCNLGVFKFAFEPQDVIAAYTSLAFDSCAPFPVSFTNTSSGGVFYVWDYGDGSPADTVLNGYHVYQNPGTFIVELIAVDSNSCNISDTAIATVTVYSNPIANVSSGDTVCAGFSVQLNAQGGQFYDWTPGSTLSDSTIAGPLASPTGDIIYEVIVSDTNGCLDTAYINIEVTNFIADAGPPASFCLGQGGAQLQAGAVTGATGPYYYEWWCDSTNTFCGLDSVYDNDPIALPTDTTLYYLQVTDANGCMSAIDSTWVYPLPVPIADAGLDTAVCQPPAPGVLLHGSFYNAPGPFDHYWTPGAGLNDSLLLNPYARPDTTTIYTLIGVSSNGCSSIPTTLDTLSTVVVTVHPLPIADAGPDIDLCFQDTTQIQGLGYGAGPNYNFEWSPVTGLSDSVAHSPFASPNLTTDYILNVWSNGCPSYGDTMRIWVHTTPTPSAGNIGEICLGDSAQLDAFANGDSSATYTYEWAPTAGLSDPFAENPMASPDTTTTYEVVAVSSWGCKSAADSVLVKLKPTPIAEAGPDTTLCGGDSLILQGSYFYSTTDSANISEIYYSWSPNQAITDSTLVQPVAGPDQSIFYYLEVRHNTCSTRDSVLITVIPEIGANATADTSVICGGDSVQLYASGGLGGVAFEWVPADGLSDPFAAEPLAAPDSSTLYQVILTEGGCFDTAAVMVEVIPSPVAAFLNSALGGCVPHSVSFLDNSSDFLNYVWNFGDGGQVSNEASPIHLYEDPGNYFVSLTVVNLGGCQDIADSVLVEVFDTASAEFSSDPGFPSELPLPDAQVQFTNLSNQGIFWVWDFGDGSQSDLEHPLHFYRDPGEYNVTLQVGNESGCVTQVVHGPFVVRRPDLFIPNVFSPNDDDQNDEYLVNYTGSQPFFIEIFDRWGVKMFESKNKYAAWKGLDLSEQKVAEGTYYYRVLVGNKAYTGPISLLR